MWTNQFFNNQLVILKNNLCIAKLIDLIPLEMQTNDL